MGGVGGGMGVVLYYVYIYIYIYWKSEIFQIFYMFKNLLSKMVDHRRLCYHIYIYMCTTIKYAFA